MWCTSDMCATTLPDFRDFMVRGSVPLQMLKRSMGKAVWREKEILALDYLKKRLTELPTELTSDAWLGVGIK